MWLSSSILLPLLACFAQAVSETGHLVIYDSAGTVNAAQRRISPEAARLIVASRLGLEQYHELGAASRDTIAAINDFAAAQQLSASSQTPVALILAQGGDDMLEVTRMGDSSTAQELQVSPVPSMQDTEELVASFAIQAGWVLRTSRKERTAAFVAHQLRNGGSKGLDNCQIDIVTSPESLASTIKKRTSQQYSVLALIMPNSTTRSTAYYGGYSLPNNVHLSKRQQTEEPLEAAPVHLPNKPHTPLSLLASNSSNTNTTTLRGILPQCFPSLSTCQSLTQNCTGHGSCSLKYTDRDAGESSGGARCYTCSCTGEVRTNKDGTKKTTQWGGPACQKKDVVAPFWLLAGFTVFMVFLLSWGVGLIWTMGEQELPSVIGAGVSGVPRR